MAQKKSSPSPSIVSRLVSLFRPAPPPRKASRKRLPETLRPGEFDALLAVAPSERDRVCLLVLRYCGLRVAELVSLRVRDVDLAERTCHVIMGKGRKDRNVPISDKLLPTLAAWVDGRTDGWLFPSPKYPGTHLSVRTVQLMVEHAGYDAGITRTRLHPHLLRHYAASDLLRKCGNVLLVQHFLGHSNIATTMVYLHAEASEVRAAVDLM